MELTAKENKKNRLVFEVEGETQTMFNLLNKELWNDSNVKVAGYKVEHPLTGKIEFTVETSGTEAGKAVADAIKRIKKDNSKLSSSLSKLVK